MKKTERLKYKNMVKRYIEEYIKPMKLQDWDIDVKWDNNESPDNYLRVVFESFDYKEAVIYVNERFTELSKKEQEEAVIHELSHIVIGRYDKTNTDIINLFVDLINKIRDSALEEVVDNYAKAIQEVRQDGRTKSGTIGGGRNEGLE